MSMVPATDVWRLESFAGTALKVDGAPKKKQTAPVCVCLPPPVCPVLDVFGLRSREGYVPKNNLTKFYDERSAVSPGTRGLPNRWPQVNEITFRSAYYNQEVFA